MVSGRCCRAHARSRSGERRSCGCPFTGRWASLCAAGFVLSKHRWRIPGIGQRGDRDASISGIRSLATNLRS